MAVASVVILVLLASAVLFGPLVWRVPINEIDFTARLATPSWDASVRHRRSRPGSAGAHALWRPDFARGRLRGDGGRHHCRHVIGAISGISRGSVDAVLMWVTDLFLALPQLPLLLLVIYLFRDFLKGLVGPEGGIFILIVLVIGASAGCRWRAWSARNSCRCARRNSSKPRARSAPRTPQAGDRHILPNSLGPVIVAGTIDVAAAIIAESTLSFLGLGFPPDIPTWGRLLFDAKDYLDIAPHWALFAGAAIFLTVLAINFIGDGLRDALDPRKVM